MVKCGVHFEVRTGFLNDIKTSFVFKGLNNINKMILVVDNYCVFLAVWLRLQRVNKLLVIT
jgi:hypothetical protein